jgi:hypothetical protein
MVTTANSHSCKFHKEETGKWYIDLPEWTGNKADLEMVEGADTMLDHVGSGSNEVILMLSEEPFEGSAMLKLMYNYSKETGGGGIYLLEDYEGKKLNQEMWLCEVTEWVFG